MNAELQLSVEGDCYRSGLVIAGRYRLLRRLEEGGMSWVWLAHHIALDVPIAIKIAKPVSRKAREYARREGRLTAALHHPSIVTVLDTGETEWGDPFVVMEHLDGCSLADALTHERRMSARDAVRLMLPVLDALALCHERGILHGDVKPANVFLAREQGRTRAKLLDFGIARDLSSREPVTELSGTPGYMAPEQVGEGRVDQRADVWASCATLYEAVAGRRAVQGRSCAELLASTVVPEIAPLPVREPGDARLWPVLERGLRAVPNERFATMRALVDALLSWQEEQGDSLVRASAPLEEAPVFDERGLCDTVTPVPRPKRKRRVVQRYEAPAPPRAKRRSVVPQVVLAAASLVLAVLVTVIVDNGSTTAPICDVASHVNPSAVHPSSRWGSLSTARKVWASLPAW